MNKSLAKYSNVAITLHWLIAIAIFLQLASGIWMVKAIHHKETQKIAYDFYQYHKSLGLTILVLSLIRLFWRLFHKAPAFPTHMKKWEKLAANVAHFFLYFFMIIIPLFGWAVVSTSPYGLPTMIFGLFEWPHISFLVNIENKQELHNFFGLGHKFMSYAMIFLLFLHISAALKHQFIDKDNIFKRMFF